MMKVGVQMFLFLSYSEICFVVLNDTKLKYHEEDGYEGTLAHFLLHRPRI